MHTQELTVRGRHDHPPQPTSPIPAVRRVGLLDRAAMHLGMALIRWGRRPVRVVQRPSGLNAETVEAHRKRERTRSDYAAMHLTRIL